MTLKLYIFCPDEENVIDQVIEAATEAGAGRMGNYSQVAFMTKGLGNWKSLPGSHPAKGKVGEVSRVPEVKIEMLCPGDKAKTVAEAIKKVHPYEEVAIDFIKLDEIL